MQKESLSLAQKFSPVCRTFLRVKHLPIGTRNAVYQPPPGQDGTYKYKGPKSPRYSGERSDMLPLEDQERNPAITPKVQLIGFLKSLGFLSIVAGIGYFFDRQYFNREHERVQRKEKEEMQRIREESAPSVSSQKHH